MDLDLNLRGASVIYLRMISGKTAAHPAWRAGRAFPGGALVARWSRAIFFIAGPGIGGLTASLHAGSTRLWRGGAGEGRAAGGDRRGFCSSPPNASHVLAGFGLKDHRSRADGVPGDQHPERARGQRDRRRPSARRGRSSAERARPGWCIAPTCRRHWPPPHQRSSRRRPTTWLPVRGRDLACPRP